jgi:hypothetical protein
MGDHFTKADWEHVLERATALTKALRAKGGSVEEEFTPWPRVPRSQVDALQAKMGFALPQDFIDLVTQFASGWSFSWSLAVEGINDWLKAPVYLGDSGANNMRFLGASAAEPLVETYTGFQRMFDLLEPYWLRFDPATRHLLPALFPLSFREGCRDNFTALRLDVSPARIYYLEDRFEWAPVDESIIGSGFREFVLGWANLGFPAPEHSHSWVDPITRQPDDQGEKAMAWWRWLNNPDERTTK